MDVFSHGLWAGAAAKVLNKKQKKYGKWFKKPLSFWRTAFWGIFPDLFAFTIPFIWILGGLIFGGFHLSDFRHPDVGEPPVQDSIWVFRLASYLYNLSHSLIIFIIVFLAVWLIFKRPVLEMGGWLLHVLMDIPTHSYKFFPTPFLWPVSGFKFDGFSWGNIWFLIVDYSALIIVYYLLFRKKSVKNS